jgi:hypothetical protein
VLTNEALQLLLVDLTEQVDMLASNVRKVQETVDMVRGDLQLVPGEPQTWYIVPLFARGEGS